MTSDGKASGSGSDGSGPEWRRRFAQDPFHRYLGLDLEARGDGYVRIAMRPTAESPKGIAGSVHGGILATLVDIACLGAVSSTLGPDDLMNGTAELNISYLRPALGERVVTEGRVLKKGKTLAVVDVDISDGNGRLFAKGRVQYSLRQRGGR